MRECVRCTVSFEPYQWNQRQCYDCLKQTSRRFKERPKKICGECKVEFQPRTIRQTYCTDPCGRRAFERGYVYNTYGIPLEQYDKMLQDQDHRCAICNGVGFRMRKETRSTLCVDHCHTTGRVRGMLCHNCNRALGLFQDNTEFLLKAVRYLEGSETIPQGSTLQANGSGSAQPSDEG